jgi:hypothetical protein
VETAHRGTGGRRDARGRLGCLRGGEPSPPHFQNAKQVSVTVTPTTNGCVVNVTQDSLHIGYIGYTS